MKPHYRSYDPSINSTLTSIFVLSLAAVSTALAADWVGDTSQDWNDSLNWSGDTAPTGNFIINTAATGIHPIIDSALPFPPVDLLIANGGANEGRLDHRSGSLALANPSANWMFVARSANTAVATYNLANTSTGGTGVSGFALGSGDLTVGKLFVGGGYYANGGVGTVNINTSGTLAANSTANFAGQGNASIVVGCGTGASGTVNFEAGTVNSTGQVWVGNIGNGVVTQTGGTVHVNSLLLLARNLSNAQAGNGSWSVSGSGVLNVENDLVVSYAGNSSAQGVLNIGAGGTVNVGTTTTRWMIVNQWDSVKGVVNVNGGTLNLNGNTALRFSTGSGVGASSVTLSSGAITSYSGNGEGTATSGDIDLMWANINGNNTFNLDGGTLSVRAIVSTSNEGTAVFNFNGGTLKSVGNNAAEPNFLRLEGANQRVNIRDGGAIIDSNGHDVVIGDALQHSDIGGDAAIDGGLTKLGDGTLTLQGINTYTGNTTINGGTTVNVANGGALTVKPSDNNLSNKITGAGTVSFDGTLRVDLSAANVADGNSWTLVDATSKVFNEVTFKVSGTTLGDFTAQGDGVTHTLDDGNNTWTFSETTGQLSLSVAAGGGFESWIGGFGLAPLDQDPTGDPDNDSVKNIVEYALGRNPALSDGAASTVSRTNTDIVVAFQRSDLAFSNNDVSVFVEYGGNLTGWTEVAVPAASGTVGVVTFTITDGSPNDTVVASIPHERALKFFGRVKAVK